MTWRRAAATRLRHAGAGMESYVLLRHAHLSLVALSLLGFAARAVGVLAGAAWPMRGGLRWLDVQCLNRYNATFKDATKEQQLEIVNEIAYPQQAKPEMQQGVAFFNRMRDLTASGFFTTEIGVKDLGYVGNVPNKWEGVPADILKQYGMENV